MIAGWGGLPGPELISRGSREGSRLSPTHATPLILCMKAELPLHASRFTLKAILLKHIVVGLVLTRTEFRTIFLACAPIMRATCRLRVTIAASNIDVIRAARRKIRRNMRRDRDWRQARHWFYRKMLEYHIEAQRLARTWG